MTAASRAGAQQIELQPTRWTAEDTEFLDPNAMAHPLPAPVRLMVDHREPGEMVDRLRAIQNLEIEIAELGIGNSLVENHLVIERKTIADFVTSITEDAMRLFHQTDRLARFDAPAILLIDGDLYSQTRMTLEQIAGTLSYLSVIQRVSILPTLSLAHSAYIVPKLLRHALFGLGHDLGLRGSRPKDPSQAAAFVLEGIPGVSARRARALLRQFGTLQGVARAEPADLQRVLGIGPATARTIAAVFRAAPPEPGA